MKQTIVYENPRDWVSALTTFVAILFYVYLSAQFYVSFKDSTTQTNIYNTCEALGALAMGFLSDKFSRRTVCLFSHLVALAFLPLIMMGHGVFLCSLVVGFFFNPLPILRAGLIDNMPHFSKIKIIALSFVIQYIPWAIYDQFYGFSRFKAFFIGLVFVAISLLMCFLFFYDRRDKKLRDHRTDSFQASILPEFRRKLGYTLLASIPAQLVYFFSDNLLENFSENATFYSILSFGSLIGALIAILYKKTPHVAVLTINYGISMVLAIIPVSSIFIYHFSAISFPMMFIIFGCLGGFGVPFVYDVILNSTFVNHRGTACGVLDMLFSISSLVNSFLMTFLSFNIFWTLMVIPLFFGFSTYLQKQAE